ncbi:MAG: methionyl-tRNA formyltransferase [Clostridia bacterium]|nr:methionyl-tRNA formyltransferase [Clostridia bacterium]
MKILFMGTPAIAARVLEGLLDAGHEVACVVTKPDRPRDRGKKSAPSEVKTLALSRGLRVEEPETLKNGALMPLLEEIAPEMIVVVAYGKILPESVLNYTPCGAINVHASLLPRYRGAAPIQRAIMGCEKETGVTIMRMDKGVDTGDTLLNAKAAISPEDTAETLTARLAELSVPLLLEAIGLIERGEAKFRKQNDEFATYAPMIQKEEGFADWERPAEEISARIRGLTPWPGCEAELDGVKLKLFAPKLAGFDPDAAPGTVIAAGKRGLIVACGGGSLLSIGEVQPAGKKRMPSAAYFNGRPLKENRIR